MKWKKFYILSLAFLPVLFVLIFSQSANAVDNAPFTFYWRSYSSSQDPNVVINQSGYAGQGNPPYLYATILSLYDGYNNYLYGFSLDFDVVDDLTFTNKFLTVEVDAQQLPIQAGTGYNSWQTDIPSRLSADTNLGTQTTSNSCVGSRVDETIVRYTCRLSWDDSSSAYHAQVVLGTVGNAAVNTSPIIAQTCGISPHPSCYNPLVIKSLSYVLSGSNSPEYDQNQVIISQNQTMIDQNNQIISELQNQSEQQQDQYEQEKQEESQREESGNESADQMAGVFNFSIPNPFLPILSMFTDGGSCVSIPTIASMVGSDETQFCPWFPASVRNVLTPVIGLSSSIILFGFVVGWLTGATRGSIEQVEEVSK